MPEILRPALPADYEAALALWTEVFGVHREYFTRYYQNDPWYQVGDTLGAWDGDRMVASVHVCRRPVRWQGRTLLIAAIANVATHGDYRGRGLSTRLLTAMRDKVSHDDFDFGLLGTGIRGFYQRLGWEDLPIAQFLAHLDGPEADAAPACAAVAVAVAADYSLLPLYDLSKRPLMVERTAAYMDGWVVYERSQTHVRTLVLEGAGYIMLAVPGEAGGDARVYEWVAVDAASEEALFRAAIAEARRHSASKVQFDGMPEFLTVDAVGSLTGATERYENPYAMICNLRLSPARYNAIKDAYAAGQAAWWQPDHF